MTLASKIELEASHTNESNDKTTNSLNQIPFQETSIDIWDKKYRLRAKDGQIIDEDMQATYERVAQALSKVEAPELRDEWHKKFTWALQRGAIPAGRIMSNAGAEAHKPATSTINCTVSGTIADSMDDILNKVHEAGLVLVMSFQHYVLKVRMCQGQVLTPQAHCRLWISTTRCVSPYRLPVVAVVHKWVPLM